MDLSGLPTYTYSLACIREMSYTRLRSRALLLSSLLWIPSAILFAKLDENDKFGRSSTLVYDSIYATSFFICCIFLLLSYFRLASRLGRRPKRRKEAVQDGAALQVMTSPTSSTAAMLVPGLLASTSATLQLQVNTSCVIILVR